WVEKWIGLPGGLAKETAGEAGDVPVSGRPRPRRRRRSARAPRARC
ncbi:MAG: hypothetical protein AVDCRST_MAG20-2700, partial [uncultured Acidimicrobiales bacterium]